MRECRWPAALVVLALTGCADVSPDAPMVGAEPSPQRLASTALEAVTTGDEGALAILMITREEYETLLWPALPDRDYVPFDFVWSITQPRSRKARRAAISEFEGRQLELVRVDLGKERELYPAFTLHRAARMWVRDAESGVEGVFPLMDVLVEMDGRWKFMNFQDGI